MARTTWFVGWRRVHGLPAHDHERRTVYIPDRNSGHRQSECQTRNWCRPIWSKTRWQYSTGATTPCEPAKATATTAPTSNSRWYTMPPSAAETGSAWHAELDYLNKRELIEDADPFLIYFDFHPHDVRDGTPELEKYGAVNHRDKATLRCQCEAAESAHQLAAQTPLSPRSPGLRDTVKVRAFGSGDERTIRNEIGRQFTPAANTSTNRLPRAYQAQSDGRVRQHLHHLHRRPRHGQAGTDCRVNKICTNNLACACGERPQHQAWKSRPGERLPARHLATSAVLLVSASGH